MNEILWISMFFHLGVLRALVLKPGKSISATYKLCQQNIHLLSFRQETKLNAKS